jgi:hypothetical protein
MGRVCGIYREDTYRILVGKPDEKRPLEELHVSGSITVKWTFEKTGWSDIDWTGPVAASSEHGDEPLGSKFDVGKF